MKLIDGLTNFVSGLGSRADRQSANTYVVPIPTPYEVDAAFRTTWLGKIIRIKAEDTVREWREWQADRAQITAIEDEEKRLSLRTKLMDADTLAMKDGGCALFMGGLPGDPAMPVNLNAVTKGSLKYLVIIPKSRITPSERVTDPLDPAFGGPAYYTVGTQRIHPDRIVRLVGVERSSDQWDGWGDPLWMSLKSAVENSDVIAAATAAMVHEAKIDVWGIPRLMESLATAEYETLLTRRVTLAQNAKSLINAIMIDSGGEDGKGGETLETRSLTFTGLSDIQDRAMMLLAGAADIPQTRMFGRAPAGMNATGDSDARNYAVMIRARQELKIQPAISMLDEVMIRSALGARPLELWYRWRDLYQTGEKEAAEIEKMYADGFKVRMDTGAINDDVLAKAELNRMIETGRYPGIEDAVEESENDGLVDPDEREAAEIARMQAEAEIVAARPVADAAPRPLYVRRDVLNQSEIVKWAKAQGFDTVMDDLHVTITYSREPVDWMKMGQSWSPKMEIPAGGPRVMEQLGEATVLSITANELEWRHREMREAGASWDHAEYQPHITISYGFKGDLATVKPYQGRIVLGPEIFEPIDDDYRAKISEK